MQKQTVTIKKHRGDKSSLLIQSQQLLISCLQSQQHMLTSLFLLTEPLVRPQGNLSLRIARVGLSPSIGPRKHSWVLNAPVLRWQGCKEKNRQKQTQALTQKRRIYNKRRANVKSCFCIKVQMSCCSKGKAKLTHGGKGYCLKIQSMFSPQHQDLLHEILPCWSTFLDVYQGAMLTDRISLALVPYKSLKWKGCTMMHPNGWMCPWHVWIELTPFKLNTVVLWDNRDQLNWWADKSLMPSASAFQDE